MEIVLDEFIINWHLSKDNNERETAESIVRVMKKKCHRMVFDNDYLNRFRAKLKAIDRHRRTDTYTTIVLLKRFGLLLTNSAKVRICSGHNVNELNLITDNSDKLVVRSALCIKGSERFFATADSALIEEAKGLSKYKVRGITPEQAEDILTKASGTTRP